MPERANENMIVRPMAPPDAAEVAALHATQIAGGFLSSLGTGVLCSIYSALPDSQAGFGFVAEHDGRTMGFIACATDLRKLYRQILGRRGFTLVWRLLRHVSSLRTIRKMVQTLLYPKKIEKLGVPEAEVLSVATTPQARGMGVASRLMQEALDEFIRRGCHRVRVLVGADLAPANTYYMRNGFRLVGVIDHHGRQENIYAVDLPIGTAENGRCKQ